MALTEKELELNPIAKQLYDKIENKTATIGVVGLGYVGLPLAVEKAKAGYKVIGFDVQQKRVDMVNRGENYIGDVVDEDLVEIVKSGQLKATTDYSKIREVDTVAICVPTPLDEHQQPDISYVENSTKAIAEYLHQGMLVVLESTTYPGTTEEVVKPILEQTGLKCGEDFFVAYSPERVDPGNKYFNTKNTPKVVGGITPACTTLASSLYRNVLEGEVHEVSSPAVAEMEKILENTFRNINIALVNEMAILCHKMGIDVWEVINAAKTKPYGFMAFYPGPGLGGHCIPIDPFYLTWKAREFKYHTRLIETAAEINNYMPEFVIERTMKILNEEKKSLNGSKVLLLGAAYKNDIDDLRESPVLDIIEFLEKYGADVHYSDPYIPQFTHKGIEYHSVDITPESLKEMDIVILTTNHSDFHYEMIAESAQIIFDTRNAFSRVKDIKAKYYKL
ncbi:nucleotide sugar dehydrogenase [Tepidibacillus fermentans]|uniref:UDP-N-acetyl-D-glucosamine dehydrogenase n=1 Tax=Tepidibacillus fermentans TaxID=1281767 RepID=A0A4R3KIH0_9BACI|nr:nucleotide sugar dehydrogenase [Tepidibacillus fermentans]TCS83360.1 UDP-N-acetyl-D-glucosamine dehydrogenase [Tepidibacillus fermentans]